MRTLHALPSAHFGQLPPQSTSASSPSKTEFVQAIKVSMDVVGRYGGPCRPPRSPLAPAIEAEIRAHTEKALAAGMG